MSRRLKTQILTVTIVALGFLRGYIFYNINWIYKTLTEGRMNQARHEFYFLLEWSPRNINIMKWFLTILFTFLFFYLSYLIVKIHFQNKSYNRTVIYSYLAIFAISGVFYLLGIITGNLDQLYGIVRTLMGMAQSFFPLMALFILFRFFPDRN